MSEVKLTPEQFAEIVRQQKPHLIEIENQIQRMKEGYGEVNVILKIRAKKVVGMDFITKDSWLLPKEPKETKPSQI